MAELDKKGDGSTVCDEEPESECTIDEDELVAAARRAKKHDKSRSRDRHHKKNSIKLESSPSKSGDGTRLRSAR